MESQHAISRASMTFTTSALMLMAVVVTLNMGLSVASIPTFLMLYSIFCSVFVNESIESDTNTEIADNTSPDNECANGKIHFYYKATPHNFSPAYSTLNLPQRFVDECYDLVLSDPDPASASPCLSISNSSDDNPSSDDESSETSRPSSVSTWSPQCSRPPSSTTSSDCSVRDGEDDKASSLRGVTTGSGSICDEIGDCQSDSTTGNDGEFEELPPIRTTNTLGDRLTLIHSTRRDRNLAAAALERHDLTISNPVEFDAWCNNLKNAPLGFYALNAFVHATVDELLNDDQDGENAGQDWSLQPAVYDPDNACVDGGLLGDDYEKVFIDLNDENSARHLLVSMTDPVAIYIFPCHGIIEIRAKLVKRVRAVHRPTDAERNKSYAYSFDLSILMGGVVIHANAELPKMWFSYHIYCSTFPSGFPGNGAQAAFCMDQVSPLRFTNVMHDVAPFADRPSFRHLLGSSFTIQPMSTLARPFPGLLQDSEEDPRISTNARYANDQNWLLKIQAGDHLMKLQYISIYILAERRPFMDDFPSAVDPQDFLLPTEGFWAEQTGVSPGLGGICPGFFIDDIDGHQAISCDFSEYYVNGQAWSAAQELARNHDAHLSTDATIHFLKFRPTAPAEWRGAPIDEELVDRIIEEHWEQGRRPCKLEENQDFFTGCPCGIDEQEPEDPALALVQIRDSQSVLHDEDELTEHPIIQQWLENIQRLYMEYIPALNEDSEDELKWVGEDAFLQNNKGITELHDTSILRKSGIFPEQMTPPKPDEFHKSFRFTPGGELHEIIARPQPVYSLEIHPWMPGYTEPPLPHVGIKDIPYGYQGRGG